MTRASQPVLPARGGLKITACSSSGRGGAGRECARPARTRGAAAGASRPGAGGRARRGGGRGGVAGAARPPPPHARRGGGGGVGGGGWVGRRSGRGSGPCG